MATVSWFAGVPTVSLPPTTKPFPLLRIVGFSAAPANAVPEVRKHVDYVTRARGGEGAVRELIDLIIRKRRSVRKV